MKVEIVTQEDLARVKEDIRKIGKYQAHVPMNFITMERFMEITGLGKVTLWRLENEYGAIKAYKFKGSSKKFYKISELEQALEKNT